MAKFTGIIQSNGFTGTAGELDTVAAQIDAQLVKANGVAPRATERRDLINLVSAIRVGGSFAAPAIDLVWKHRPACPGALLASEAVAEAALRAGVTGISAVTHNGRAATFGVASMADLGSSLGF